MLHLYQWFSMIFLKMIVMLFSRKRSKMQKKGKGMKGDDIIAKSLENNSSVKKYV